MHFLERVCFKQKGSLGQAIAMDCPVAMQRSLDSDNCPVFQFCANNNLQIERNFAEYYQCLLFLKKPVRKLYDWEEPVIYDIPGVKMRQLAEILRICEGCQQQHVSKILKSGRQNAL